jgi:DNA-binding transcriptional MerR regulator
MKAHFAIPEIVTMLSVSEDLIVALEQENLILPIMRGGARLFALRDVERIRVAHTLISDMGVNLAGVEVALHLRAQLIAMSFRLEELSRRARALSRRERRS